MLQRYGRSGVLQRYGRQCCNDMVDREQADEAVVLHHSTIATTGSPTCNPEGQAYGLRGRLARHDLLRGTIYCEARSTARGRPSHLVCHTLPSSQMRIRCGLAPGAYMGGGMGHVYKMRLEGASLLTCAAWWHSPPSLTPRRSPSPTHFPPFGCIIGAAYRGYRGHKGGTLYG